MINYKYLSMGNQERIYNHINGLANGDGIFCEKSYIKFYNGIVGTQAIDVYIDDNLVGQGVKFNEFTDYVLIYPGQYSIYIYAENNKDNIIYFERIEIERNQAYLAGIAGTMSDVNLIISAEEKNEIPPIYGACINFINYVADSYLDIYLTDGTLIYNNISFGVATRNIILLPKEEKFYAKNLEDGNVVAESENINLEKNIYYTIIAVVGCDGKIKLEIIRDGINYLDLC